MFNKNFYPTPYEIALKMRSGLNLNNKTILEPSAGKGDLVEGLNKYNTTVFCIEKNLELCEILRGKNYKIIGHDFLKFKSDLIFDIILMNPPFDEGVKHFLKAWEISENGTEIRCLLNAESIKNPYSKERQLLLKIIEDNNGDIEFLGNCFKNAERSTNVEVVLIKIKNNKKKSKFEFEYKKESFSVDEININQLSKIDILQNLEDKFNKITDLVADFIKLKEEIKFYAGDVLDIDDIIKNSSKDTPNQSYNFIMNEVKEKFWNIIFQKTKIVSKLTSGVRKDFFEKKEQQGLMPFTIENIENLLKTLILSSEKIFKDCISNSFDHITKYHKENRVYIEGWKTNERWKVGSKFILPRALSEIDIKYFKSDQCKSLQYNFLDKIEDIEKSLCFISGKTFENINTIKKVVSNSIKIGEWHESEFFKFKLFRKGTMHFIFLDKKLLDEFNRIACSERNWLGF